MEIDTLRTPPEAGTTSVMEARASGAGTPRRAVTAVRKARQTRRAQEDRKNFKELSTLGIPGARTARVEHPRIPAPRSARLADHTRARADPRPRRSIDGTGAIRSKRSAGGGRRASTPPASATRSTGRRLRRGRERGEAGGRAHEPRTPPRPHGQSGRQAPLPGMRRSTAAASRERHSVRTCRAPRRSSSPGPSPAPGGRGAARTAGARSAGTLRFRARRAARRRRRPGARGRAR